MQPALRRGLVPGAQLGIKLTQRIDQGGADQARVEAAATLDGDLRLGRRLEHLLCLLSWLGDPPALPQRPGSRLDLVAPEPARRGLLGERDLLGRVFDLGFCNLPGCGVKIGKVGPFCPHTLWRSWTAEHRIMPGIVEFPRVVQDALAQYGDLFANECQRRHLAEYLTALFVAERKTVLGIHDEFAQTTDQSCLNRFLTEAVWDVEALNRRRLELLQKDPTTRYSDQGVIPIDTPLIDRDGLLIPDAGWYWDHAEQRNKIAQDSLFINYVCTSGKHYPLEFRLFRKEEICQAIGEPFRNHTALCCELS